MSADQIRALSNLKRGQAAVFNEEDDLPILVRIPPPEEGPEVPLPDRERVRSSVNGNAELLAATPGLFLPHDCCATLCSNTGPVCAAAREIAEQSQAIERVQRMALTALAHPDAVNLLWPDLILLLAAAPPNLDPDELMDMFPDRCVPPDRRNLGSARELDV